MKNNILAVMIVSAAIFMSGAAQAALVTYTLTGTNITGGSMETVFTMDSEEMIAAQNSMFSDRMPLTSAVYTAGGARVSFDTTNAYYGSDSNGETIEFRAYDNGNTLRVGSVLGGFADFEFNATTNEVAYSGIYNDPLSGWTDFSYSGSNFVVDLAALAPDDGGFQGWINSSAINADFTVDSMQVTVSAVPLPAAVWMFGAGLVGLIGVSRRRLKQ